jgi:hypothetical protein
MIHDTASWMIHNPSSGHLADEETEPAEELQKLLHVFLAVSGDHLGVGHHVGDPGLKIEFAVSSVGFLTWYM